jgi:hypothetical protein
VRNDLFSDHRFLSFCHVFSFSGIVVLVEVTVALVFELQSHCTLVRVAWNISIGNPL